MQINKEMKAKTKTKTETEDNETQWNKLAVTVRRC